MRPVTVVFGILLIVGSSVPLVILATSAQPEAPVSEAAKSSRDVERDGARYAVSSASPERRGGGPDALAASGGKSQTEQPEVTQVPPVAETLREIRVCYTVERARPAVQQPLQIESGDAPQQLVTDDQGVVAARFRAGALPVRILAEDGRELYRLEAGDPIPALVNLQRLSKTSRNKGLLIPEVFVAERFADTHFRFRVYGSAALPLGSRVSSGLKHGKSAAEGTRLLRADGLLADFETSPNRVPSRSYQLRLAWRPLSATPEQRQAVYEHMGTDEIGAELYVQRRILIGISEEAQQQEREAQRFFRSALTDAEVARDFLLVTAWMCRGTGERLPSGRGWRREAKLFRDEDRGRRLKSHPLWEYRTAIPKQGRSYDKWRDLLDHEFPEMWKPYLTIADYPHPSMYPTATENLATLFQLLDRAYRLESRLIAESRHQKAHPNDRVIREHGPGYDREVTLDRIDLYVRTIREHLSEQ